MIQVTFGNIAYIYGIVKIKRIFIKIFNIKHPITIQFWWYRLNIICEHLTAFLFAYGQRDSRYTYRIFWSSNDLFIEFTKFESKSYGRSTILDVSKCLMLLMNSQNESFIMTFKDVICLRFPNENEILCINKPHIVKNSRFSECILSES